MSGDRNMGAWLDDQEHEFERARGQVVSDWHGLEMAVKDRGSCSQFGDEHADCLQLVHLVATVEADGVLAFTTYQDDANFGLRIGTSDPTSGHDWSGIYRIRRLTELPTGPIDRLELHEEDGVRDEVLITIANRQLLLVAAEIYENNDGSLEWHRFDESVLAFTKVTAADSIDWLPRRQPTRVRFIQGAR